MANNAPADRDRLSGVAQMANNAPADRDRLSGVAQMANNAPADRDRLSGVAQMTNNAPADRDRLSGVAQMANNAPADRDRLSGVAQMANNAPADRDRLSGVAQMTNNDRHHTTAALRKRWKFDRYTNVIHTRTSERLENLNNKYFTMMLISHTTFDSRVTGKSDTAPNHYLKAIACTTTIVN